MAYAACPSMHIRGFVVAALLAGLIPMTSGCFDEDEGQPPEYAGGYQPMYYDGYVVYYDESGRPYYHENGAVVWVAASSPYYADYVSHWHSYGPAYRGWYGHYGYRYRGYSRGRGHYGRRR
jgi:hypothetical protein